MKILGLTPDALLQLVDEGIKSLKIRCNVVENSGYFTVFDCACNAGILMICQVGVIPPKKLERHFILSQEKAYRLFQNPAHFTSFQSRDTVNSRYGGAVRAGNLILSFSGISELDSEALMTYVAYHADWISRNRALENAVISKNNNLVEIL